MTVDTWQMIDDHINKVMKPFYDQVDKTRKRLNLTLYKMLDPLTGKELDDVIIVTENRSGTYMARIIARLMSSRWQTVIAGGKGEVSTREAHKIEGFIQANLDQADEYLFQQYGMADLNTWLCNHVCHTSLIGVQWMARIEDGEYKIHCLPLDMRYTPFVLNKWVAPITFRSKEDLLKELEEYEKLAKDGDGEFTPLAETLQDTDNEVRDYWGEKDNELWIAKQLVFRQKNIYGKPPSVIVWVPSGFMFRDKGYLEHESPSLLFLNENLYDQLSRQLSIDATLGFGALQPAYEKERETISADQPSEPAPKRGVSVDVLKGERHQPVPTADINRAELASRDQTNRLIDDATPLSPRSYTSPPSAIEVVTEVELLDELQNPRIVALSTFKSQLARLLIEQFTLVAEKDSVFAGRVGKQGNFSVKDLKDPKKYTISYQMTKHNRRLALVNEARAMAVWGKAPMEYILRDIWGVEDPDGWQRAMELEKAKAANPAIGLAEMAVRYAEEAEDMKEGPDKDLKNWQSMMLVHEYVMLMRQRMQPMPTGETQNLREATKETGSPQGLISLIGQKGAAPRLPAPAREVAIQ